MTQNWHLVYSNYFMSMHEKKRLINSNKSSDPLNNNLGMAGSIWLLSTSIGK